MAYRDIIVKLRILVLAAAAIAVPALATAAERRPIDPYGRIELRAVQSDLELDDGDEFDSSGVGAGAEAGVLVSATDATRFRAEGNASTFDYGERNRSTRTTYGAAIELEQKIGRDVVFGLHARKAHNVAVVEADSADQALAGASLQWERGDDRLRLEAEYRTREYDTITRGEADGFRVAAQYNRRFGPYHWLRFDVRHEDMQSNDEISRSHERQVVRVRYSKPVAKLLRLRPVIEYRQWNYDARTAQGAPAGTMRRDRLYAPGAEIAWGRDSRGLYAAAGAEYRIRSSTDEMFRGKTARLSARLGYRF